MDEEQMAQYRAEQARADKLMAVILAKVKATELAVASLIASHPNPSLALAIWDRTHLDLSDESFDAGAIPGYQGQMALSLASWSRGFRLAADAGPPASEPPQG